MKVLAISSSRVGNGDILENALPLIQEFLGNDKLSIAFVPFASVQRKYDEYGKMIIDALASLPYSIDIVKPASAKSTLQNSNVIMIGGGNTFKLLHDIYELDLFDLIQSLVKNGVPYIGWSAGANITGKSICTTNDMPIIEPLSFVSLGFFNFQINPHYINLRLEGHHGETRDQRLEEFVVLNPSIPIVALPEGTALSLNNSTLNFIGDKDGILFQADSNKIPFKKTITVNEDLSWLHGDRSVPLSGF